MACRAPDIYFLTLSRSLPTVACGMLEARWKGTEKFFILRTRPMLGFLLLWFWEVIFHVLWAYILPATGCSPPTSRTFQHQMKVFSLLFRSPPALPRLPLADLHLHSSGPAGLCSLSPCTVLQPCTPSGSQPFPPSFHGCFLWASDS